MTGMTLVVIPSFLASEKKGGKSYMDMMTLSILGVVVMVALVLAGMNVGISMLLTGFIGLVLATNMNVAMGVLRAIPSDVASKYVLVVIPMFILMGNAAYKAGISDHLFVSANKWLSRLPGNLLASSTVACAVFSTICGSQLATTATIGGIALPKMFDEGYDKSIASGVIAVSGGVGMLIPPSTVLIIYGIVTENSIGQLFAAGVFPGILFTIIVLAQIQIRMKVNPALGPKGYKCSWSDRFMSLVPLWPMVILFLIVIVGMFSGFFTVNEASGVAAFFSFVFMALRRKLNWENVKYVLINTGSTSCLSWSRFLYPMQTYSLQ